MAKIDWEDKTNDRRKKDSPGRRAADYITCHSHDETCDRVKALETRMVGWRVFTFIIGGLGAAIIFCASMTFSINAKVDALSDKITTLTVELRTHAKADGVK